MSERFGSWELESLIAVGGLGEIWRATRGEDVVALKRLHTHLVRNDDARAQFTLEQRLATMLPRHPNVIHADEAGSFGDRPYVALDLARGEDLRHALASRDASIEPHGPSAALPAGVPRPSREPHGPSAALPAGVPRPSREPHVPSAALPAGVPRPSREPHVPSAALPAASAALPRERVLAIVGAASDGAAHLHRAGFVHGDLCPANLMVSRTDHVTVIDLGIARAIGGAGVVRGTHAYMAPEQVRGEGWTPATDVFALGVVLWELASSARLFHRGPPWLSMAAVMEDAAPPLDDPALDAVVQAALVKDPAKRIQSASAFAARLRSL